MHKVLYTDSGLVLLVLPQRSRANCCAPYCVYSAVKWRRQRDGKYRKAGKQILEGEMSGCGTLWQDSDSITFKDSEYVK